MKYTRNEISIGFYTIHPVERSLCCTYIFQVQTHIKGYRILPCECAQQLPNCAVHANTTPGRIQDLRIEEWLVSEEHKLITWLYGRSPIGVQDRASGYGGQEAKLPEAESFLALNVELKWQNCLLFCSVNGFMGVQYYKVTERKGGRSRLVPSPPPWIRHCNALPIELRSVPRPGKKFCAAWESGSGDDDNSLRVHCWWTYRLARGLSASWCCPDHCCHGPASSWQHRHSLRNRHQRR